MALPNETSMGGGDRRFPSTQWSRIAAARDLSSPASQQALKELCGLYWKPIYAYIRAGATFGNEEAKDLTQEFFVELVEGKILAGFAPDRGSFRSYLRGAVKHFLLDAHRRAAAIKRGGGRKALSLEDDALPAVEGAGAEEAFDREWAASVLRHALDDLKEELTRADRAAHFEIFERYELSPPPSGSLTYQQLGEEFGKSEREVGEILSHCRNRLRRLTLHRIRETTGSDSDLQSEVAEILAILGRHGRSE